MKQEVVEATFRGAPPLSVVAVTLAGIELQDWVYGLTIIWLLVQIVTTCMRAIRESKDAKAKKDIGK